MSKQRADVTQLLSVVAAGFALVLGSVMLVGGLGIAFAIATSEQPPAQFMAVAILAGVGAINVWAGFQFRKRQGLVASAVATTMLMAYLATIGDLGEPFVLHALYLILLAALGCSGRSIRATA